MSYESTRAKAGWVAVGGGTAVIVYWTMFFAGAIESGLPGSVAHEFELAFPGADALLAAAALTAGVALIRGTRSGSFFLVVASAMSLYLGFLDVAFYSRQGLYVPLAGAGGVELLLNVLCIAGGGYGLRAGWSLRGGPSVALDARSVASPWARETESGRPTRHLKVS